MKEIVEVMVPKPWSLKVSFLDIFFREKNMIGFTILSAEPCALFHLIGHEKKHFEYPAEFANHALQ